MNKNVTLLQCTRRPCGHVMLEHEREWKPHSSGATKAVCPQCGFDTFFTLNAAGQAMSMRDMREKLNREIDPSTIAPSPRMGPKRRAQILDAKRRAGMSVFAALMASCFTGCGMPMSVDERMSSLPRPVVIVTANADGVLLRGSDNAVLMIPPDYHMARTIHAQGLKPGDVLLP